MSSMLKRLVFLLVSIVNAFFSLRLVVPIWVRLDARAETSCELGVDFMSLALGFLLLISLFLLLAT